MKINGQIAGIAAGLLLGAVLIQAGSVPISGTENHMFLQDLNGGTAVVIQNATFVPSVVSAAPLICNSVTEGAIYQNNLTHVLNTCNGTVWSQSGFPDITDNGTTVTINTAATFFRSPIAADGTGAFSGLLGTLPAVTTGGPILGASFYIIGSGSSSNSQYAIQSVLAPGYTGSSQTLAFKGFNQSAGTGLAFSGNSGIYGLATANTAGDDIGILGYATNNTGRSFGG